MHIRLNQARPTTSGGPGFSASELQGLERASTAPVQANALNQTDADTALMRAAKSATVRTAALWGILLLGLAVLGFMVWRLLRPAHGR